MRSTLTSSDTLDEIEEAYQGDGETLSDTALRFADFDVSEEELVRDILDRNSTLRNSEGVIKLPGVQANKKAILGAVKKFKDKKDVNKVRPAKTAGHDDLAVSFIRSKTAANMQASSCNNFKGTVSSEGEKYNVFPFKGTSGYATLDSDEWLFFTGDFPDLSSDAVITAIQYANVDGEKDHNPEGTILQERDTDLQLNQESAELVKSSINIDGYGQEPGNVEIYPVAVHIATGDLVPSLT